MNNNRTWEALSMKDRASFIKLAMQNGYRDLDSIRNLYNNSLKGTEPITVANKFDDGGHKTYKDYASKNNSFDLEGYRYNNSWDGRVNGGLYVKSTSDSNNDEVVIDNITVTGKNPYKGVLSEAAMSNVKGWTNKIMNGEASLNDVPIPMRTAVGNYLLGEQSGRNVRNGMMQNYGGLAMAMNLAPFAAGFMAMPEFLPTVKDMYTKYVPQNARNVIRTGLETLGAVDFAINGVPRLGDAYDHFQNGRIVNGIIDSGLTLLEGIGTVSGISDVVKWHRTAKNAARLSKQADKIKYPLIVRDLSEGLPNTSKNLLYHMDYGNNIGAFQPSGAYIKNGKLYPGIGKDINQLDYIWFNENKPYAMGTSHKGDFTRSIILDKNDIPDILRVRDSKFPIGQWNGKSGFVRNSEMVTPTVTSLHNAAIYNRFKFPIIGDFWLNTTSLSKGISSIPDKINNIKGSFKPYGNLRFIRQLGVVPEVDDNGFAILAPSANSLLNMTTDIPFRTHDAYGSYPGAHSIFISPEKFRGHTPLSIEPSDTFFLNEGIQIKPKDVTFVSGDRKALEEAKRLGYKTKTSDELLSIYDEYTKSDQYTKGIENSEFSEKYFKAMDDFYTKLGRPTLKDYQKLERVTNSKSGVIEQPNALNIIKSLSKATTDNIPSITFPNKRTINSADYYSQLHHVDKYNFVNDLYYDPTSTVELDFVSNLPTPVDARPRLSGINYELFREQVMEYILKHNLKPLKALGGPLYNEDNPIEAFQGNPYIPVVRY